MRTAILLITIFALAFPAHAQSATEQILKASDLRRAGHAQAAIGMLEPLTQHAGALREDEVGAAWDVLALSYQDAGMLEAARPAFEHAIEALRSIPSGQARYAATIADLASLENELGQQEAARALWQKARDVYDGQGNSAGVAITSTSLAMVAAIRNDYKGARQYLERAVEEAHHTSALREDDLADMSKATSAVALHDRRYEEAIAAANQAMEHWTRVHGPDYIMIAAGLLLRAQGIAKSGDYPGAVDDLQHALAIAEEKRGRNSVAYSLIEMTYARVLRDAGEKQRAAVMKKEASSALASQASRECSGCTINAYAFR